MSSPSISSPTLRPIRSSASARPSALSARRSPRCARWRSAADLALREGNASFAIAAQFDDVDGFKVYADHPEHVRIIKELIGPYIESRHPVQFTA